MGFQTIEFDFSHARISDELLYMESCIIKLITIRYINLIKANGNAADSGFPEKTRSSIRKTCVNPEEATR